MFFAQLLKILFFGIIIYSIISLIRFLLRAGRAVNDGRAREEEQARRNIREKGFRMGRDRKGTIELDKDQYKVE